MPKRKTRPVKVLKKPVKKPAKTLKPTEPTKASLRQAYQLVTKDLFNRLVQAKDGDRLNLGALGALGSFTKNERKVKSGIIPRGPGGATRGKGKLNTYVYYRILFKPARRLKEELNQALKKKYS